MRRRFFELLFKYMALAATALIAAVLLLILATVAVKGFRTLSWALITQPPRGDYYLGGSGGIANAIIGSLYLGIGATLLALLISLPAVLYLRVYADGSRFAAFIRMSLDVLWGVPSIVFGTFGFVLMIYLGLKASLLAGIVAVAMLELPIMIRSIDEVARVTPRELEETAYNLGSTKFETAVRVVSRQVLPGIVTGALLAFGRGIGDAASVLFTAGFTDRIPGSLTEPAATLPLAIFFQLGTPFEEVRARAYGAALVLVVLVLGASIASRLLSARLSRSIIK